MISLFCPVLYCSIFIIIPMKRYFLDVVLYFIVNGFAFSVEVLEDRRIVVCYLFNPLVQRVLLLFEVEAKLAF